MSTQSEPATEAGRVVMAATGWTPGQRLFLRDQLAAIEAQATAAARAEVARLREAAQETLDLIDSGTAETDDTAPLYDFLAHDAQQIVERLRAALSVEDAAPRPGDYPEEGAVPTGVQNAWNEAGHVNDLVNAARVYANVVEERYAGRTGWASVAEARSMLLSALALLEDAAPRQPEPETRTAKPGLRGLTLNELRDRAEAAGITYWGDEWTRRDFIDALSAAPDTTTGTTDD